MLAPKISIIIPTFKRHTSLKLCLSKILEQVKQHAGTPCEVIVCDDEASAQLQSDIANIAPHVRYIVGPQHGPADNRNAGAKVAQGQWLIFIDDDCIPQPGWLEAYAKSFNEHPEIEALEGKVIAIGKRRTLNDGCPENLNGDCFWSCNIAIKKDVFNRLGRFDESFPYPAFEDIEFYQRIKKHHIAHIFLRSACVSHPWKAIGGWDACLKQLSSTVIFLNKHPDQWPNHYLLAYFKSVAKHLLKNLLPGIWHYRGAGTLSGISYWLAELYFGFWLLWHRPWIKR